MFGWDKRDADAMQIGERAWSEVRRELQTWSPPSNEKTRKWLAHFDKSVAQTYRSYEKAVAFQPKLFPNQVKRTQETIEDIQRLLKSQISKHSP